MATAGRPPWPRSINNGYNQAGVTGYLHWPLLDAIPPGLPHQDQGLVFADEPWSGQYQVNEMTWAIAHTTQFVGQGWTHVGSANKALNGTSMGSYNSYRQPGSGKWTMVVQTSIASASQRIAVTVRGGLSTGTVHVWATNLHATDTAYWFKRLADVTPTNGTFSATQRRVTGIDTAYTLSVFSRNHECSSYLAGSART
jgi:Glycosyl hydrolase family 59